MDSLYSFKWKSSDKLLKFVSLRERLPFKLRVTFELVQFDGLWTVVFFKTLAKTKGGLKEANLKTKPHTITKTHDW